MITISDIKQAGQEILDELRQQRVDKAGLNFHRQIEETFLEIIRLKVLDRLLQKLKDKEALEWKNLLVQLPELNKPFVAIYNDGSGAIVSMRVAEDDYINDDGEIAHSHESLCESCGEWMYLHSSFRFWYQLRGE